METKTFKTKIKGIRRDGENELYINGRRIESAIIASMMKREDVGFNWGTDGPDADLTAVAICSKYIDEFHGGVELSGRFKNDFVKNWPADKDVDVELDLEAAYGGFRDQFWKEWWIDALSPDQRERMRMNEPKPPCGGLSFLKL